jgi:hypothetical protein
MLAYLNNKIDMIVKDPNYLELIMDTSKQAHLAEVLGIKDSDLKTIIRKVEDEVIHKN